MRIQKADCSNFPISSEGPHRRLLNATEAASFLCVVPGTLAKWRVYGTGPKFIRVNRRIAYDIADIAEWLSQRRVGSTSEVLS